MPKRPEGPRRALPRPVPARRAADAPFPTREEIMDYIQSSPVPVGKREIARAFNITGDGRIVLKELLKELEGEGSIEKGEGRRVAVPAALPEVAVLIVSEVTPDGEVLARPTSWAHEAPPPRIYMAAEKRGHPALAVGDRVLARLSRQPQLRDNGPQGEEDVYEGRTMRKLDSGTATRIVGIYDRARDGGRLKPVDRRAKAEFAVADANAEGAQAGELVVAELLPASRLGLKQVRVVERLGSIEEPRAVSLIAIAQHAIPTQFAKAAIEEAEAAPEPTVEGRTDLRDFPLVTIDGEDARDFDDAVFAEPDTDPNNPGGWHLLVAIADVSFYVRPGMALDRNAFDRGNSVYFPDRVVPMLPEALSNELCSLKPEVNRACLAVHMWIDAQGRLKRHRFVRGLMRSAARLTYTQVQKARDGAPDELTGPLMERVINPLYGAFAVLQKARDARGTLELDLPERLVKLDEAGTIQSIGVRPRLDSHRLVEEFMIAANVAAAEALEAKHSPCMYRVHAEPARDKLEALRQFLGSLGYTLAKGQVMKPILFTRILNKAAETPEADLVNTVILRSQSQALYQPENIGHFGLALPRYAHFTSPIRRYADLVVHRALVKAYGLGPGGLDEEEAGRLVQVGEHISVTERRAATAERDALDRYVAAYLSDRVGGTFTGRIGGVTRFGLFVTLDETGADGLVPISTLPDDFYDHDEANHQLVGRRWGRIYRLGTIVKVRLVEADRISGSMVFALLGEDTDDAPWLAGGQSARKGADGKGGRARLTRKTATKARVKRPPLKD
ncbi:ribonuclease R [Nitrospirillum viridazoti]|uniref:Ribonuclease R n=1 Tax=Nitrospirillum amazonense TaxID=28077 RepID=A0A560I5S0_9PROT|nr:ribonuclease R [Nitrospirillum amazonense]TWB54283.1 RNAse R [Nitrospirillum amazonense]